MIPEAARDDVSAVVSPAPASSASAARDRLLRCSRRIDWRFLLPDPELGRTALVGAPDPELVEALGLFAESLDVVGSGGVGTDGAGTCDVVVLRSTRPEDLVTAGRLLRTGGSLYWEIEGRTPISPAVRARLRALGFEEPRHYWHRPTFAACREIVPLDDDRTLDWVLGRRAGSRAGTVRLAGTRMLRALGLLRWVTSCRSCVARKTAGEEVSIP